MKTRTRLLAFSLVITAFVCLFLWQSSDARVAVTQDDEWKALYDNQEAFDCLSGSARTMLESRYGKKEEKKEDGAGESSATGSADLPAEMSISVEAVEESFLQALSALANPLVNDPALDTTPGSRFTQSETTIVLGSGMTLIAGFNDSGSFLPGSNKFTGFSRSTDMGATWTDGGTLPTNPNGDAGDPVLARDNTLGRTYFSTLNFSGNGLRVFSSNNDGLTWNAPVNGGTGVGAGSFQDKEWMTVDNFPGACQGNVYLAWRDFAVPAAAGGIRFSRSTDNGATFGPSPGLLLASPGASNVQGAFVTVGPNHAVYVFWLDQSAGAGTPNIIKVRKSTDCGATFAPAVNVATLLTTGVNGSLGNIGGFRSNSFVQAVVNPTDANKIYLVHNDNPAGADSGDVFLRQSTDGGATWGAAVKINNDATTNTQFFPTIAVKPDGSALAASWYDRRRDPANSLIEYWGAIGTISGSTVTFGPNFRISDPFPAVFGKDPVVNSVYMGDYDQMVADNNFFYVTWGDNRLTSAPDVRFAKIPMEGPGPILDLAGTTISGGNGNGVIDFNECNNLTVKIMNNGTATATGIIGVLSTSTPGVTITQPISDYPDLAPGAMGSNVTPFRISTSPGFVCGTTINLTLTLNSGDVINFSLPSGTAGAAVQFDNNTPTPIPDLTTTNIPITVSGITAPIADVNVSFFLTHTFDADLNIFLIGPDGTTVELTTGNGGGGDNYGTACSPQSSRTTFDDAAATSITAGVAPFAGTFRPEGTLSAFNGKSGAAVNGTWTLRITDAFALDIGTLNCVSLFIAPTVCTNGGGGCPLGCVLSQGYWKNHPNTWPVNSLTLGTVTYTKAQLLSILSQPVRGNGLVSLAKQLIAARLNLASGAAATPAVLQAIADANALIGGLVIPPVGSGSVHPSTTSSLNTTLDNYNNGLAPGGPPDCP